MVKIAELLNLHTQLWKDPPPKTVRYRGENVPVRVRQTPTKDYRSVTVDDKLVITQNLQKPSRWTKWVKSDDANKVTWVIKDGYEGQVIEDEHGVKVKAFHPDRDIFDAAA